MPDEQPPGRVGGPGRRPGGEGGAQQRLRDRAAAGRDDHLVPAVVAGRFRASVDDVAGVPDQVRDLRHVREGPVEAGERRVAVNQHGVVPASGALDHLDLPLRLRRRHQDVANGGQDLYAVGLRFGEQRLQFEAELAAAERKEFGHQDVRADVPIERLGRGQPAGAPGVVDRIVVPVVQDLEVDVDGAGGWQLDERRGADVYHRRRLAARRDDHVDPRRLHRPRQRRGAGEMPDAEQMLNPEEDARAVCHGRASGSSGSRSSGASSATTAGEPSGARRSKL